MMQLFLDHVSASYADSFLVMQLDQAAWHQTKELRVPENIPLITQPAYSPELNPTEKLWEELREKQFANVACTFLDEVIDRLCQGLNQLEAQPDRVGQMTFSPISVWPGRP
jgi:transposase